MPVRERYMDYTLFSCDCVSDMFLGNLYFLFYEKFKSQDNADSTEIKLRRMMVHFILGSMTRKVTCIFVDENKQIKSPPPTQCIL